MGDAKRPLRATDHWPIGEADSRGGHLLDREELEPERFDQRQHPVQRCLIRNFTRENSVCTKGSSGECREGAEKRPPPNTPRSRIS